MEEVELIISIRCYRCNKKISEDSRIGWSVEKILEMHHWNEINNKYYCNECTTKEFEGNC